MENTALNGTTTTTTTVTKNQDWKQKKGYGPIIVAVSLALLLGLSFYAGRHSAAMRMPNGVASSSSSSSLSLVGSGTAAAFLSGPATVVVGPGEPCETVTDCRAPKWKNLNFFCVSGSCNDPYVVREGQTCCVGPTV